MSYMLLYSHYRCHMHASGPPISLRPILILSVLYLHYRCHTYPSGSPISLKHILILSAFIRLGLPSGHFSSFPPTPTQNLVRIFFFIFRKTEPSFSSPLVGYRNIRNILRGVQIMELPFRQFYSVSFHFLLMICIDHPVLSGLSSREE